MQETSFRFRTLWLRIGMFAVIVLAAAACTLGSSTDPTPGSQAISGAPVVRVSSPAPNATYLVGTDVNISVRIENAGPDINRVEIKRDGAIMGTADSPNTSGAASFIIEQGWIAELGEHTFEIVAYREDGTSSEPGTVTINVVEPRQTNPTATSTSSTTDTTDNTDTNTQAQPTATTDTSGGTGNQTGNQTPPTATTQPTATQVPPTPTPSTPMGRLTTGANVRRGPDTAFATIGSLAENSEVKLLAISTTRTWYRVEYYNTTDAWVFANLISATGNVDSLPVEAGPPLPPTATPTPIPSATPIPSQVNLTVVNIQTSPHPLICNQASEIQVTVKNEGSAATSSGGKIRVWAILVSSGETLQSTETVFGALAPGEQVTASAFLTVSTHHSELQRVLVEVDSGKQITESNEGDNQRQDADYTLAKGGCP